MASPSPSPIAHNGKTVNGLVSILSGAAHTAGRRNCPTDQTNARVTTEANVIGNAGGTRFPASPSTPTATVRLLRHLSEAAPGRHR